MVRNTYGHKLWTFPGGGIVRGETAEQAIRREVMEEVGIHVQKLQKIGEFESRDEYRRDRVVVFAGESKGRQVTIQEAEILEARWCNPEHRRRCPAPPKKSWRCGSMKKAIEACMSHGHWDQRSIRQGPALMAVRKAPPWLHTGEFPAYKPARNPIEHLRDHLKRPR